MKNMKNWNRYLLLIAATGAAEIANAQSSGIADTAAVYLVAEKGNYVGWTIPGGEQLIRQGDGVTFRSLGRQYDGVAYIYTRDWNFAFQAPEPGPGFPGNRLEVGFYGDATRWPFNSWNAPGIDVNGNHRGSNQTSGWFNVLDVAYDTFGSLSRLAVDFRQFENLTQSGPSLFGSLRYNSPVAITSPVPEPATVAMILAGVGLIAARRRQVETR